MLISKYFKDKNCEIHQIVSEPIYHIKLEVLVLVAKNIANNVIDMHYIDDIMNVELDLDRL